MNRKDSEFFRRRLETWFREVKATLHGFDSERVAGEPEQSDLAEQATHCYERELLFRRLAKDRQFLYEIRFALNRIIAGTFGTCERCGLEIGPKRLSAVPWTRYCIGCQESVDRRAS